MVRLQDGLVSKTVRKGFLNIVFLCHIFFFFFTCLKKKGDKQKYEQEENEETSSEKLGCWIFIINKDERALLGGLNTWASHTTFHACTRHLSIWSRQTEGLTFSFLRRCIVTVKGGGRACEGSSRHHHRKSDCKQKVQGSFTHVLFLFFFPLPAALKRGASFDVHGVHGKHQLSQFLARIQLDAGSVTNTKRQ